MTVSRPGGKRTARTRGIIDTGAEITLIDEKTACAVGKLKRNDPVAVGGVGGGRAVGYNFKVRLRIGKRQAVVMATVPFADVVTAKDGTIQLVPLHSTRNLVGIDFLRAAEAVLNFGKRSHFNGAGHWLFDGPRRLPITPAERLALARMPVCRPRKR